MYKYYYYYFYRYIKRNYGQQKRKLQQIRAEQPNEKYLRKQVCGGNAC